MLNDADVLIRHSDFAGASEILANAGFKAAIDIPLDDWMSLLGDRVYRAHDFLDFVDDTGTRIDLHWQVRTRATSGFTVDSILTRSTTAKLSNYEVQVVSAADSVLLTTHHIMRERFAPASAVKDLVDVQCWLEQDVSISDIIARARDARLMASVIAVTGILATMGESQRALEANNEIRGAASARDISQGDRLASIFCMRLKGVAISDIGIGLASASPSLIARYLVSRVRSMTSVTYRRHKFAGNESRRMMTEAKTFLADLVSVSPRKLAAYRALASQQYRGTDAELSADEEEKH
jgi:hypothetical protein